MAQKEELPESGEEKPIEEKGGCHPGYLVSLPGVLRLINLALGITILGHWIPGFEHNYINANQIVNFRDFSKNYGAGYKSETLNQFVLADIIICIIISLCLLVALLAVSHSHVDWNRMNKLAHFGLTAFHFIGTICAVVGTWYFQENCCRVDLEWNGLGFRYKPAVHEFGYPSHNMQCNCWLTKRESESETETLYTTSLWEPQHYPDKYAGEENTFVSFAAHHIHLHVIAVALMVLNTGVYALSSFFSKPHNQLP